MTRTGGQKNALSHVRKVTALQAWARAGDSRVLVCDGEMVCTKWTRGLCEVATEGQGCARVTTIPLHGSVTKSRSDNLLLAWQSA